MSDRKVQITLKDPDGVYDSLKDAAGGGDVSELETLVRPWVEYGEYVTIEIDLDAQTARVVPVKD